MLTSASSFAQMETKGKEFWGTTFDTHRASLDSAVIFISSEKACSVTIELLSSGNSYTYNVAANSLLRFGFQRNEISCSGFAQVQTKSFRITSTEDVSAYLLLPSNYATDATVLYPSKAIPMNVDYLMLTYGEGPGTLKEMAIVSHDDNTQVEITLRSTTPSLTPDSVYSFTLDEGECVQLRTFPGYEISGGKAEVLTTGHKISLFCGNFCTYAGGCGACDLLIEQVPPKSTLGRTFLIAPLKNHFNGYIIEVAASETTIVERDGIIVDTLQEGEVYHYDVNSERSVCITTDVPVIVSQIMKGKGCNGSGNGDPALVYISPVEQLISHAIITTSNTNIISQHFLSIIIPKAGIDSLYIDGVIVPRSKLAASNCGDFYWYTDSVNPGTHAIKNYFGFLAYIYGTGGYESYLYTAGSGLRNLEMNITFEDYPLCDSGRIFIFEPSDSTSHYYKWFWDDGSPPDSGFQVAHSFINTGEYLVKLAYAANSSGLIDTAYQYVYVNDEDKLNLISKDKLIACTDSLYTIEVTDIPTFSYLWNTGDISPNLEIDQAGRYTLIATDSVSQCTAYDTVDVVFFDKVEADFIFPDPQLCGGTNIEMIENVVVNQSTDSIISYNWHIDFVYHNQGTADTLFSAVPNNYDIELRIESLNGCRDSISKRVVVSDTPRIEIQYKELSNCLNSNLYEFRDFSTSSFGQVDSVVWVFSDLDTIYGKSALKHYNTIGHKWVDLHVYTGQGCHNTQRFEMEVIASPEPGFIAIDSIPCIANNSFVFEAHSPDSILSFYIWDWGDGTEDAYNKARTPAKHYEDTGVYNVQLITAFASSGCTDTAYRDIRVINGSLVAEMQLDSFNNCEMSNYARLTDISSVEENWYSRKWLFGDTTSSTDSSVLKHYSKAGAYTIELALLDSKGCRDTAELLLTIHPTNSAQFSIKDSFNCINGNFFEIKNDQPIKDTRFRWIYGDGRMSLNLADSLRLSYSTPGTYTFKLITETYLYACKDTFVQDLIVYPKLNAQARIESFSSCIDNNEFRLSDSTDYGGFAIDNSWYYNQAKIALNSAGFNWKLDETGQHDFILIVGDESSCPDTTSISATVMPKLDANIMVDQAEQCLKNNAFELTTNYDSSKDSIISFIWNSSESTGVTSPTYNVTYSSNGSKVVQLIYETFNGCVDTLKQSLKVHAQLNPSIAVDNKQQCLNDNLFSLTYSPIEERDSIQAILWDFDDGFTSTLLDPMPINYLTEGIKSIRIATETDHGCTDTAFYEVEVYATPNVEFTSDTVCYDEESTFTSLSSSTDKIIRYEWIVDGQHYQSDSILKTTLGDTGSYVIGLLVETENGCIDSIYKPALNIVIAKPEADFSYIVGRENLGALPIEFFDSSRGQISYYQWTFSDGDISSDKNPVKYFTQYGELIAQLTVENFAGCSDTISKTISYVSDDQILVPTAFSPNDDVINNTFGPLYLPRNTDYSFTIFNRWGEKIFETENTQEFWDGSYKGESCQQGVYVYIISYITENGINVYRGTVTLLR